MSDFKGVWIPAKVWEISNKELLLIEKAFLCQIYSLCNDRGCYASNTFFAEFFGVSKSRCTQIIKKLEDQKYISVSLTRKGEMVVQRVVSTLNKCNEMFAQGDNYIKQGSKHIKQVVNDIKQGSKHIKQGCLIHSASTNIDKNNKVTNTDNKKEREKEPSPFSENQISDFQKKIAALESKILSLETEKEKEKSCGQKEKGKHEFPKQNGKPKAQLKTPPHVVDSQNLKQYEVALKNFIYPPTWSIVLIENFLMFCEWRDLDTRGKFGVNNVKILIHKLNTYLDSNNSVESVEKCVLMAVDKNWKTIEMDYYQNAIKKHEQKQTIPNQKIPLMGEDINHLNVWMTKEN